MNFWRRLIGGSESGSARSGTTMSPGPRSVAVAHQDDVLVIDRSACSRFVDLDLRPWAAGEHRTADGLREQLAGSMGFAGNDAVLTFVDDLLTPVLIAQRTHLETQRAEPISAHLTAAVAEPRRHKKLKVLAEAAAWLRTGASLITTPSGRELDGAPAFIMYLAFVQGCTKSEPQWMQLATGNFLVEAIGQSAGIQGRLFQEFHVEDVVRSFLAAKPKRDLYRRAHERLFSAHESSVSETLALIERTLF
jgi:hypothetical protein